MATNIQKIATGICIGCLFLFIILFAMSFSSLDFNEYGLDYNQITENVDNRVYSNGVYFLGLGHKFIRYPRTLQTIDFSDRKEATAPRLESRTKDGLSVKLSVSFQYQLLQENLTTLYSVITPEDMPQIYQDVAQDILTENSCQYTAFEFFNNRAVIQDGMRNALNNFFSQNLYAFISYFQLRDVDLPTRFEEAITNAEVSRQDIQKATFEQQNAMVQIETVVKSAEFGALSTVLTAQAKADSYLEIQKTVANMTWYELEYETATYKRVSQALGLSPTQLIDYIYYNALADKPDAQMLIGVQSAFVSVGEKQAPISIIAGKEKKSEEGILPPAKG